jgi:undecaprenyl-diphosphatase
LDEALLRAIRGSLPHPPAVVDAVRIFTRTGQHAAGWLALGAAGMALDAPRRAQWRTATATVAGAYVANQAIKLVVRRRRPELPDLPALVSNPTQLSFPSAHATSSFAAARAFAPLAGGWVRPVAAGLAFSRLYLGVHYPSDVAAGAALGWVIGGRAR